MDPKSMVSKEVIGRKPFLCVFLERGTQRHKIPLDKMLWAWFFYFIYFIFLRDMAFYTNLFWVFFVNFRELKDHI